ncbi:MAG TPA: FtsX-like permease family protein [Candidatus Bipolaricaulota bacterium]
MRLTLILAWRNLMRNRRRSLLTILAVLFPVLLLDLMWGLKGAFVRNMFDNTTLLETGHLQVHEAGYKDLQNTLPLIQDVRPILEALGQDPQVRYFTVRLELPALAAHGNRSQGVLVQGIEPDKARQISLMDEWVSAGRPLQADDHNAAIAGAALLAKLGAQVQDPLILLTSHPQIGTGVLLPAVVGQIEPPSRDLSRMIVQVPLADAQNLVKNPNAATSVVILLQGIGGPWDQAVIDAAAARLQMSLGDEYVVEPWQALSPETASLFNIVGPIYLVFSLIFFLLGGLVVLNTLYLSVLERTRELGVILALGSSRRRVLGWVESESVMLAGIGSLIGSLLGVGLVWWGGFGFQLPGAYQEIMSAINMTSVLYLRITLEEAVLSGSLMFFIALLAAAYPGWKAARLEPIEAMRFVG